MSDGAAYDHPVEAVGAVDPWSKIDTTVPHSARMYDWWLGGKDNFAVDRAMGEQFLAAIPTLKTMAQENRQFLGRTVRYLSRQGIRQFLDIGTGIPTAGNVHEVAQAIAPDSRVVYVDNDPIVLAHARALMVGTDVGRTAYIDADLREPQRILSDRALVDTLDLSRPVALMLVAILMLLDDEDDPVGKVAQIKDALPSGSYLVISHPGPEFNPEAMAQIVGAATGAGMTLAPRTREQVEGFFEGWELLEPGVAPVMAWHPEGDPPADPHAAYYWGAVGRKP